MISFDCWSLAPSGDRDLTGSGGGGGEAVLRRVPHHRDAHVARRADGTQGKLALLSLFLVVLPGGDRSSRSQHAVIRGRAADRRRSPLLGVDYCTVIKWGMITSHHIAS